MSKSFHHNPHVILRLSSWLILLATPFLLGGSPPVKKKEGCAHTPLPLSPTPSDSQEQPPAFMEALEERRHILLYGIEEEVLATLEELRKEEVEGLDDELHTLFDATTQGKIRLAILQMFAEKKAKRLSESALVLLDNYLEGEEISANLVAGSALYLGAIREKSALGSIQALLSNRNKRIIQASLKALAELGDPEAGEEILKRLDEERFEDQSLREEALMTLGEIGTAAAVPFLMEVAGESTSPLMERAFSCVALGKIGAQEAIPLLKRVLGEENAILRSYALSGVSYFDDPTINTLLIAALRDSFWKIRVTAARGLGQRQATEAIAILAYKAEKDPEINVKKAALAALGKIKDGKSASVLLDYYQKVHPPSLRGEALRPLVEGHVPRTIEAINNTLESQWETKRPSPLLEATSRVLATVNWPSLEPIFQKMLSHRDPSVRINALRGIRESHLLSLRGAVEKIAARKGELPHVRKQARQTLDALCSPPTTQHN